MESSKNTESPSSPSSFLYGSGYVPMSSKCSSSQTSSTIRDELPLITIPQPLIEGTPPINRNNQGDGEAREWPCAPCGIILGLLHFTLGISLLLFDILTNSISQTAFAITASLTFIICALLCFIAVRRVDKCAQVVLMCFSVFSCIGCLSIFLESSVQLNVICDHGRIVPPNNITSLDTTAKQQKVFLNSRNSNKLCDDSTHAVLSALIAIALSELTVCLITLIVCFRSLYSAYALGYPSSPYSTLIVGDLKQLQRQPRLLHTTKSV